MKKSNMVLVATIALAVIAIAQVSSASVGRGMLFHDGDVVRTLVNPARMPYEGTDPLYVVSNGVEGQLAIAGTAPGTPGFHGGAWAFYDVSFSEGVTPYLLTSDENVMNAEAAGDVTVTRIAENDFRCPVQP